MQEFIAQARKARDLWSGSYLISYLAAQAMFAVARELDEKAIVFPTLEDTPLWRWNPGQTPNADRLRTPCLPNRFLALVPAGEGETLARLAHAAVLEAWENIQRSVRAELQREVGAAHPDWDAAWDAQVERFPQIDWIVHPWTDAATARTLAFSDPPAPPLAPEVRDAATHEISDSARPEAAWALHYATVDWKFAAAKSARAFAAWPRREGPLAMANKDHLDGRNEVLGGPHHESFWRAVAKRWDGDFKEKQRYGALTVIKRRWDKTWLPDALSLPARDWFPDTGWIAQLDKDLNDDDENAQRYYAVLMMDGDDLGQWLSGEKSRQRVTADYHRDLSRRLARFALDRARGIVEEAGGHLLYSGGDDALAMLPAARALGCAHALVSAFREILPDAGASAGIAIGHVRSPMQDTIQAARAAERTAKAREGKDAVCFAVRKRSGEGVAFTAPWSSGAVAVWRALDQRAAQFSHALAHDYGARLETLLIESGSATGASIAEKWRAPLEDIAEAELRHVLRRQGRLTDADAATLAAEWRAALIPALPPRDFLHFWLAWAFIRRLPPEKIATVP